MLRRDQQKDPKTIRIRRIPRVKEVGVRLAYVLNDSWKTPLLQGK